MELFFEKSGNTVNVYLNTSKVPENLIGYFLSLDIIADAELLSVTSEFSANINFANSSATKKLINIEWPQSSTTGLEDNTLPNLPEKDNAKTDLTIFPNPILSPELNINFNGKTDEELSLKLLSSSGQEVLNQTFISKQGFNNVQLNIPDLNKGIYLLMIIGKSQSFQTEKIIIQ